MKPRTARFAAISLLSSGFVFAQTGVIGTYAGDGTSGYSGDGGAATGAMISNPFGLGTDSSGNLFIADLGNSRIRRVDATTGVITTVAGGGTGGDGGPATAAQLEDPCSVKADSSGNLFISESCTTVESGYGGQGYTVMNRIRRVDAITGIITTIAGGLNPGFSGDGGPAVSALLNIPAGLAIDAAGDIFIADSGNNRIRRIDAVTGFITTVAGNGVAAYLGDGGLATSASLNSPTAIAIDSSGDLYVADALNNAIRRIDAVTGIITTVAGTGVATFNGDGIAATTANLGVPLDVLLNPSGGASGQLVIADSSNYRVRMVDFSTGSIWTLAGNGAPPNPCCGNGDGGEATLAELSRPTGLGISLTGSLYIADLAVSRVRKDALPSSLASTATALSANSASVPAGNPVTFTALITANTGSAVNAGGGVYFFIDSSSELSAALANGSASVTTSTLATGVHHIVAEYTGDSVNFGASASTTFTLTITAPQTSVTLSANPNPANPGQAFALTASVSPTAATGTVTFWNGATSLGTATLSGGSAALSGITLGSGSYSLTAQYGGDATHAAGTSSALAFTVKTASSVALTSSANPSNSGQAVTFTATISPSSATGSVQLLDGTTVLGTSPVASGVATFSSSSLASGAHSITAAYSGDANNTSFTSSALSQTVLALPTVSVTSTQNPSPVGGPVTFIATVTPATATGAVQFLDGATVLGTGALTGGSVSFTTSALTQGTHSITAAYSGDSNNSPATSPVFSQGVKLISGLTLVSSANPSVVGQAVTFTVNVNPAATGTVQFLDSSTVLATVTVSAGVAAYSTSSLALGSHSISVIYSGDSNYLGAGSAAITQSVRNASTVSLGINAPQPVPGQSVTFTAYVNPSTATGTVQFLDGGNVIGTAAVASGSASFSTTLTQGTHSMTAVYSGDSNDAAATSSVLTVAVKASVSLVWVSSANPSIVGQSVTFTATITPSAATGTVQFLDNGTVIGTGTLNAGVATFSTSSLTQGTHPISLLYSGDSNYMSASTSSNSQIVNAKNTTTTTVISSQNPGYAGTPVVFTAAVTPPTATGTVQFLDGATVLGTVTLSNGAAAFTASALAQGTHSITAVYAGDSSDTGSTSAVLSQVMKLSAGLGVGINPSPAVTGQTVTISASVASAATGTVQFTDGATVLATVPVASGTASYSTSTLAAGVHTLGIAYSGDANYFSQSTSFNETVLAATSLLLASSANPSTVGQSVTFTATVTPSAATGSVQFYDGSTLLGTSALSGGSAVFSTSSLAQGTHPIQAIYSGDATHAGSYSAVLSEVRKVNTSTALTSNDNPSSSGQAVTFTAVITPSSATGNVQFFNGSTLLGTSTLSGGNASFTTSSLAVGSHSIQAVYGGDTVSNASSSTVLTQIVKTATTMTLTSSKNPASRNNTVVYTATVTPSSATGTVQFFDGGTLLGTEALSGGRAEYSQKDPSDGTHSIQALYSGDSSHGGSAATLSEVVKN